MIELPQEFKDKRINPTFHTSLVPPYIKNNDIQRGTPKYTMTLGTMRTMNGLLKKYWPINGLKMTWNSKSNGQQEMSHGNHSVPVKSWRL